MINTKISEYCRRLINKGVQVIDTETTGQSGQDVIIQVAVVDGRNLEPRLESYINTDVKINPGALAVHGITKAKLRGKPKAPKVFPMLEEIVSGKRLISYNGPFDYRFVRQTYEHENLEFKEEIYGQRFFCLLKAFKLYTGRTAKLGYVCASLGIQPGTHDALTDTIAAANLLHAIAEEQIPDMDIIDELQRAEKAAKAA